MIEARLLSAWEGFVGSVALIAIIVVAFSVMVRVRKVGNIPQRLGTIVGIVILLIMLPAIILSLWNSMTLLQHIGVMLLAVLTLSCLIGIPRTRKSPRK